MTQVRSGLASMKRAWSGNQHDLGCSSDSITRKAGKSQPSSEEIYYEWSDTPSPPSVPARLQSRANEANKENSLNMLPSKKAKTESNVRPDGSQNGFVAASTVFRSNTSAPQSRSAPQTSSLLASSSNANIKATIGTKPPTFHKSRDFALKFDQERKAERMQAPSYQTNRSISLPNVDFLSTPSQLRELQRTNANLASANAVDRPHSPAQSGAPKQVNKIFLSNEQRTVLQMVVQQGKNVFFTGSAGTGKSVLLREIIRELRHKYSKKQDAIAVTASTGIAACNIGGVTLHSFAGFGLGKEDVANLVGKIRKNRKATTRWMRTQVLIIDEISMVDPGLLDKLNDIAQIMKKKRDRPFGGIQVIITGDFFQLPPVSPTKGMTFAFQANCWDRVVENKVNLTQVFRQKDSTFVTMLNEMRFGQLSQRSIDTFRTLTRAPSYDPEIVPTELFPMRVEVERANQQRLDNIQREAHRYIAVDGGNQLPMQREKTLANFMAPKELTLKVGAQVMLIKNLDETLVNGSIGKVLDFVDEDEYSQTGEGAAEPAKEERNPMVRVSRRKWPLVRFSLPNNGGTRDYLAVQESWKVEDSQQNVEASRVQVPLILAWAISIHKAQGQTLPCCRIDLGKIFEKGQAYVALSRATALDSLQVLNFRPEKVMAHPDVIKWSKSLIALD